MPIKKVLLALVLSVVLAGCSLLPTKNTEEKITLKYWGLWENTSTINTAIEEYKKIKPNVEIAYEKRSPQQHRESLISQINQGKGPDIFRFHNTWTPMLESVMAPLPSSVMSADEFKKSFYPTTTKDLVNSSKKIVGIPLEIDGLALFYNEDLFAAAGISTPPQTWQELAQDAAKLTVKDATGNIKTAGVALGTAEKVDHFSDILGLMILQNGGDPKTATDKNTADALDYYVSFATGPNRVWDETMPASTIAFAGSQVAMYFAPSWRVFEIRNQDPVLNFKLAPVPQLEGGKVAWASYWAEGVSVKSAYQKEAWEFIKFLSDEERQTKLYSEAAKSPGRSFGEPYSRVSMASKLTSHPQAGAIVADAPYMRSFPMASRTFDNGLNDQIIDAYKDAVNKILGGTSSAKALETTAQIVTKTLTQFGAK